MPSHLETISSDIELKWQPNDGAVDTSLLLDELRRAYQRDLAYVEVDFRELVRWVRIGDQLTHQIHPYPAKLLPNIVHFFTRASSLHLGPKYILDPFCGSGTVALEASLAGQTPYIADANPLARIIARAKTTAFDPDELREIANAIIRSANRFRTAPDIPIINETLWYSPTNKKALEILLRAIRETAKPHVLDFFFVCFSVVARRLSHADPAISVPVRLRTKKRFTRAHNSRIRERLAWINDVKAVAEFARVCEANIERVQECNEVRRNRKAAVEVGLDARHLHSPSDWRRPLGSGSVPLVLTSPPYGSAQKYVRASSLSLNWLGLARPEDLAGLERRSIGREHVRADEPNESCRLPPLYEQMLGRVKTKNPTRERITRRYLAELRNALEEMARVTMIGGRIVLVIGNNMVCGEPLRNDLFVSGVLEEFGLRLEFGLIDHIKSRGLMTKRNKTASVISRECVLVFSK